MGRPVPRENRNSLPLYAWDNELGYHEATVEGFKVNEKLITNSEFFKFVQDGGYEQQEYWSEEGWYWAHGSGAKHPQYWIKIEETGQQPTYVLRNMISQTDSMPWDWPAEVNCLEAHAYCRWISKTTRVATRLPTEDEYQLMLKNAGYE